MINKIRLSSAVVILPLIILFKISLSSCSDEPSELPSSDGLVSFFDFQHGATDFCNIIDGIDHNVKYPVVNFRTDNIALLLGGKDSYLEIPFMYDYEEKTVSLWFYVVETYDNLSVIFSSDNPELKYGLTLLNVQKTGNSNSLYFNVSNYVDTILILTGRWYHAAIATSGSEYSYYLDGTLVKSGKIYRYISSSQGARSTLIGCDRYKNKRFFHGMTDNLRIYNRKLSDSEVRVLYQEKSLL